MTKTTPTASKYPTDLIEAVKAWRTGSLYSGLIGYLTTGGTYVLATSPQWTDSGLARDLVAILPAALNGTRVVPLTPLVNPDVVDALREGLDIEGATA